MADRLIAKFGETGYAGCFRKALTCHLNKCILFIGAQVGLALWWLGECWIGNQGSSAIGRRAVICRRRLDAESPPDLVVMSGLSTGYQAEMVGSGRLRVYGAAISGKWLSGSRFLDLVMS